MAMYVLVETYLWEESLYTVHFFGTPIAVTVTSSSFVAHEWLSTTISLLKNYPGRQVVGLGVQWNPFYNGYTPAHTLQLCFSDRCLIFQLSLAEAVPQLLRRFLLNTNYTFVGLWNGGDARRLRASWHKLEIHKLLDLRVYAASEYRESSLCKAPVERIVKVCLGYTGVRMKKEISMSKWDAAYLSRGQVLQACIDAHVSFLIGENLSWGPLDLNMVLI